MGLYSRFILPRLIDLVMRAPAERAERRQMIPRASGSVLEVGFGSGLNLPFYGPDVREIHAVDPSAELWRLGRRRVTQVKCPVRFLQASAEQIPLDDDRFDTVTMTWTLCSIPDPLRALAEVRRVLKPDGRLVFIEHGRSPDPTVRAWQARLTPWWRRIAGGCHLDREVDALLAAAGFHVADLSTGYAVGPKPFSYLFKGVARPGLRAPKP